MRRRKPVRKSPAPKKAPAKAQPKRKTPHKPKTKPSTPKKSAPKKIVKVLARKRPPARKPTRAPAARTKASKKKPAPATPTRKHPRTVAKTRSPKRAAGIKTARRTPVRAKGRASKPAKKQEWVNLSTPRPTGFSEDYGKARAAAPVDEVVYLSPRTLKPVKRTTKTAKVLYGHKAKDGTVKVLHPYPQAPDERLRAWLAKSIKQRPGNAVLFLQQSLAAVIPPKDYKPKKTEKVVRGVLQRREPRGKKFRTVHETRLAVPSEVKKQQAVRYTRGRVKPVEPGRTFHKPEELKAYARPAFVQPGRVKNIAITGATIWDSLAPLVLDKQLKRLKPWEELFYEYMVIYRDPVTGEKMTIPGRGRHGDTEASQYSPKKSAFGKGATVSLKKLEKAAWPIVSQIARSIRLALAESGVRFSSKYTLGKIQDKLERRLEKAEEKDTYKSARESAALERALAATSHHKAIMVGGRRQGGKAYDTLLPLNPEREDGKTFRKQEDALRIMLRVTIVPDNQERMKWEAKHKKRRKK